MALVSRLIRCLPRSRQCEQGEALPVAILFLGVFFTILIGIHVVLVTVARTAVQAAADAALAAAQAAGHGPQQQACPEFPDIQGTRRQCDGILAARIAMAGASSSIIETQTPVIAVESDRGVVTALVYGGTVTPVLGVVELAGQACGPLDDVPAAELVALDAGAWLC